MSRPYLERTKITLERIPRSCKPVVPAFLPLFIDMGFWNRHELPRNHLSQLYANFGTRRWTRPVQNASGWWREW